MISLVFVKMNVMVNVASATPRCAALVIGNGDYPKEKSPLNYISFLYLHTPVNDAKDMARVLHDEYNIDVFLFDRHTEFLLSTDLTSEEMQSVVKLFAKYLRQKQIEIGIFYFSGHGVGRNNQEYMLPVNPDAFANSSSIETNSLMLSQVQEAMNAAGTQVRLLIEDACRNDVKQEIATLSQKDLDALFKATVAGSRSYAAQDARNSVYTTHLLDVLVQGKQKQSPVFVISNEVAKLVAAEKDLPIDQITESRFEFTGPQDTFSLSDCRFASASTPAIELTAIPTLTPTPITPIVETSKFDPYNTLNEYGVDRKKFQSLSLISRCQLEGIELLQKMIVGLESIITYHAQPPKPHSQTDDYLSQQHLQKVQDLLTHHQKTLGQCERN